MTAGLGHPSAVGTAQTMSYIKPSLGRFSHLPAQTQHLYVALCPQEIVLERFAWGRDRHTFLDDPQRGSAAWLLDLNNTTVAPKLPDDGSLHGGNVVVGGGGSTPGPSQLMATQVPKGEGDAEGEHQNAQEESQNNGTEGEEQVGVVVNKGEGQGDKSG